MGRLASETDFKQGGMYSDYRRYPFFAQDADLLTTRYPSLGRVLVAGCGYGYLVDELSIRGWDAWGCDASLWAVGQRISARIQGFDILIRQDMTDIKNLGTGARFDLIVTEDVLTVLSDVEVATALTELRRIAKSPARELFHIVTCANELIDGPLSSSRDITLGLNWKTHIDWVTTIGNNEPVMNREGGKQVIL